jgi:hypothetical protein
MTKAFKSGHRYCMGLSVRGALTNWEDRRMRGMFKTDEGREMTPAEAKAELLDLLSKGHEQLPFGKCDNFDPKEGCLGHRIEPPSQ